MTVFFEDVTVGQELVPFQRKTGIENWNRYAAVNDEFMPVHMDVDAARDRGEKDVYGMAGLRQAYFHCLLRNWLGDDAEIRRISCKHLGINFKNDTLTAKGRVEGTRVSGAEHLVDIHLAVENQSGEVLDTGKATVVLPRRPRPASCCP